MIRRFIIFGASGDLTSRYLLPALAQLYASGRLPEKLEIIGVTREPWDTEAFRRHIAERLRRHAPGVSDRVCEVVTAMLRYHEADATDPAQVVRAVGPLREPFVAYLALPPAVYRPTIEALAAVAPPIDCRIVIEKPFGENLVSAQALNRLLHQAFPEQAVFRIDHFLGIQTVQNILGLRFANRIFEPLWNAQHLDRIEIIWDETLGMRRSPLRGGSVTMTPRAP